MMSMIILAFTCDAFTGLNILKTIFTQEIDESDMENKNNLICDQDEKVLDKESFNCRLPNVLKQGAIGKLF
jgi:hypothetical protein